MLESPEDGPLPALGWIFDLRRHLSCAARDDSGAARPDRGDELPPDGFEQPKRQQSTGNACSVPWASRPQVWTRPLSAKRRFACRVRRKQRLRREAIGFGEHDPRAFVVEPETAFGGGGKLYGKLGVRRRRVRDRQHRHHSVAPIVHRHENDRARSVLDALFLTAAVFRLPQAAVADCETRNRIGKAHAASGTLLTLGTRATSLQRHGASFETRPQFKPGAGPLGAPQDERCY